MMVKIDQVMLCREMNGTHCVKSTKKINNLCIREMQIFYVLKSDLTWLLT